MGAAGAAEIDDFRSAQEACNKNSSVKVTQALLVPQHILLETLDSDTPSYAIVLPGRKSVFRDGFRPQSNRENMQYHSDKASS